MVPGQRAHARVQGESEQEARAAFGDQIDTDARVGGRGEQVRSYGGIRLRRPDGSPMALIGGTGIRLRGDTEAEDR